VVATIVVALCRIRAPSAMPASALTGASSAEATTTRRAPGWLSESPASWVARMACVEAKETPATSAPYTVMTAVTTATFAAIRARRSGTAAKVVRIRPVAYSPTIVIAPMLATARTRIMAEPSVKASRNANCSTIARS
jgi:hypothetical protein